MVPKTAPNTDQPQRLPPQATMGLLDYLTTHAMDEDYEFVSERRQRDEARGESIEKAPSRSRIGVVGALVMALFAVRGPFKGLTVDNLAPLRARVLDDIVRAQEQGGIRNDIDSRTLAHLVEEGALMVLDEATTEPLTSQQGHLLVMQVVLGLVGLGWREANELIESHSELNA